MGYVIETKTQIEQLLNQPKQNIFLNIIPESPFTHPAENKICCVFIKLLISNEEFIINIGHEDAFTIDILMLMQLLSHYNNIYVIDKKETLHYLYIDNLIDITTNNNIDNLDNGVYDVYHKLYGNLSNQIIPIEKHLEYNNILYNKIKHLINLEINNFFNNKVPLIYNYIEKNKIKINSKEINKKHIYSTYEYKTKSFRVSVNSKEINLSSLSDKKQDKEIIIPNNDFFVEFDIMSYHLALISKLINYNNPIDFHSTLSLYYKKDYNESKKLTFKQIYGEVFPENKELEFFKKLDIFKNNLIKCFNENGYIECPYSLMKIYNKNISSGKLLSYLIHCVETYNNVIILKDIIDLMNNINTKLILVNYDSFLFDFCKEDINYIYSIKNIFEKRNLGVRIYKGVNYGYMDFKYQTN
jgi:hypothetical protein